MPERIQLRRTKGWRKPESAVVVARPTKWGNPYSVGGRVFGTNVAVRDQSDAVALFRSLTSTWRHDKVREVRAELGGRDLACWCPLDEPCHADVLLEIANAGGSR